MAHRKRTHASLGNLESDIARKWIAGFLCGAEMRATVRGFVDASKTATPAQREIPLNRCKRAIRDHNFVSLRCLARRKIRAN
jgi:hypothetical protein